MVAIDQFADVSGERSFVRVFKSGMRAALRDLAYPVFVYRRLRDGKISDTTPNCEVALTTLTDDETPGLVQLTATETIARLHAEATTAVSIASSVTQVQQDANSGLDWVAYELAAIRHELSDDLHR